MIGTLIKLLAYSRAPRTTFAVSHPRQAVRLRKAQWDMKHAIAPRVAALAAVVVALPIGYAIGRMVGRRLPPLPASRPRAAPVDPARGPRPAPSVPPQSPASAAARQAVHES